MTIYFYGADEVPYGCFSNFSGHGFDLDGHWWTTSEHYFQAQKFPGTRHAELIRRTASPLRAAELGRDRSRPLRRDWDRVKDDVMRQAVTAKFTAHADIRAILLDTGDEEIVEDTRTDHYWGRGRSGTGKNMLGRILMRTRTQLRTDLTQNANGRATSSSTWSTTRSGTSKCCTDHRCADSARLHSRAVGGMSVQPT